MSIPAICQLFHAAQFCAVSARSVNYPLYQKLEGLLHSLSTQLSLGLFVLANVADRKKDGFLPAVFLAIALFGNQYNRFITGIATKNLVLPNDSDGSFSWGTSEKEESFRHNMLRQILANVALAYFTPYQRAYALCATMSAATCLLTFNWVWLQKKAEFNKTDKVPQFRLSLQALFDNSFNRYPDEGRLSSRPPVARLNECTPFITNSTWIKKEGWLWDTWSIQVNKGHKEALKAFCPKVEVLTEGKRFFIRTGWTEARIVYTK